MVVEPGPASARLFDPRARRFLYPFLAREQSVAAAARELGVSISRMRYQVERLLEVGLIEQTRSERRTGRPVRYYRSVADDFELPLETFPEEPEQLLADGDAAWEKRLRQNMVLSASRLATVPAVHLVRTSAGGVDFGPRRDDLVDVDVWSSWNELRLTRAQQCQLETELRDLWARWLTEASSGKGRATVILRLGLA